MTTKTQKAAARIYHGELLARARTDAATLFATEVAQPRPEHRDRAEAFMLLLESGD